MMKLIKLSIIGLLGGISYAFISFYLLTPYFRQNLEMLPIYGFQGLLFVLFYYLFSKVLLKNLINRQRQKILLHTFIGAVSGLLSGGLNIFITYYNAILNFSGVVSSEVKSSIFSALLYYGIGSLLFGLVLGLLIGRYKQVTSH